MNDIRRTILRDLMSFLKEQGIEAYLHLGSMQWMLLWDRNEKSTQVFWVSGADMCTCIYGKSIGNVPEEFVRKVAMDDPSKERVRRIRLADPAYREKILEWTNSKKPS